MTGYTGQHCRWCGEDIRVGRVHTLLPSGGCREDRAQLAPRAREEFDQALMVRSVAVRAHQPIVAPHTPSPTAIRVSEAHTTPTQLAGAYARIIHNDQGAIARARGWRPSGFAIAVFAATATYLAIVATSWLIRVPAVQRLLP